jgi:putative protease
MEKEIGKVIHWYDKIGVAVVKLSAALKKGETIKVKRGEEEFEEVVSSMQLEHKDIETAKKGSEVAVKLGNKAHEGAVVYRVT